MKTWRERVVEARARGRFTQQDNRDAGKWETCAVGEQARLLPGVVTFRPMISGIPTSLWPADYSLREFGWGADNSGGFTDAVHRNDFDQAERMLDAIEDRVLELKRGQP